MPAASTPKTTAVGIAPLDPSTKSSLSEYSAVELRVMVAQLRAHLGSGISEIQIAEEMGLSTQQYNSLKREMYNADKIEMASKNSEEIYIDYRNRQEGCIKDLEKMCKTFETTKQYNAMVGAIRAKSDIIDRIVARGQEFGVLEKVPEKKQIVAGILVAALSNEELRARVSKESVGMNELFKKYGDADILALPEPAPAAGPAPAREAPPPSARTIAVAPVQPSFNAGLKPHTASGGLTKAAGGKARTKVVPPPFSLSD